jgi:cytochrome b561
MMGHKSVGLTILMLTLARLASRLSGHRAIPLPDTSPRWQRLLARTTHVLFFVLLIAMPLAGWISTTAAGGSVEYFWLFRWPDFPGVPLDKALAKSVIGLHEIAGKTLIGLIVLHIAGGLKEYFVDKDNVLQRMLPFLPRRAA